MNVSVTMTARLTLRHSCRKWNQVQSSFILSDIIDEIEVIWFIFIFFCLHLHMFGIEVIQKCYSFKVNHTRSGYPASFSI